MSTPTQTPPAGATRSDVATVASRSRMPRWATAAVFGAAIVIAAVLWLVTDVNVALLVLLVAVVGTAVVVLWSRAVEGGRKATDRLVTCTVTGAFLLAMVPLVSLIWQVVSKGIARLDAEFFSSSMVIFGSPVRKSSE